MPQLAFLIYIPRSGSTLLSKMLDGYRDVTVSLEANLPDGIVREEFHASSQSNLKEEIDELYEDRKFRNWDIPKHILIKRMQQIQFPVHFSDILPILLEEGARARGQSPSVCVYKTGGYTLHIPKLRSLFPDSKILIALRDPRAVYNSQKKAIGSKTDRPMAVNPIAFTRLKRRKYRTMRLLKRKRWFKVVQYENLVCNPTEVVEKVLSFLEVPARPDTGQRCYEDAIPPSQQHLHPLIHEKPRKDRIDAWQSELSVEEIWLLDLILGDEMQRWGYEKMDLPSLSPRNICNIIRYVSELPLYFPRWLRNRVSECLRAIKGRAERGRREK
ncbi:MAG: sulfotransferase family protein [Candidatus Brocadiia bacterium]